MTPETEVVLLSSYYKNYHDGTPDKRADVYLAETGYKVCFYDNEELMGTRWYDGTKESAEDAADEWCHGYNVLKHT